MTDLFTLHTETAERPKKAVQTVLLLILFSLLLSCSKQEAEAPLKVGGQAPDFSLTDLDGNIFSLTDFRDSPVVLRFFLTDCKFCRADTPVFNQYYERFASQGLGMIYIDTLKIDTKVLQSFKQELQIQFPVARDDDGTVTAAYQARALPQTIVLDPDHKIIAAILGGVTDAELKNLLSPYLSFDVTVQVGAEMLHDY